MCPKFKAVFFCLALPLALATQQKTISVYHQVAQWAAAPHKDVCLEIIVRAIMVN
jgi:hypothetical protein